MLRRTAHLYLNSFRGLSRDIWLLALVMLLNRSGTMVILFLTVYLTQELRFSLAQAGAVMSCFGLGSMLGAYLGGWLTDRIGYYRVQFYSLLLTGAFFFVVMLIQSFAAFCITIFILSTIADTFRPANLAAISAYSKPENYTRSISLIRLAINLGFSAGPAMGGLLAASVGYNWLFIVDGLTCIVAAIAFRLFLREKKERLQQEESQAETKRNAAFQDKTYLIFLGLMLLMVIPFIQILSTLPVFYKEKLLMGEDQIGLLFAANGLLIVFFEMPMVYFMERRWSPLQLVSLGAILVGMSYLVFNLLPLMIVVAVVSMVALTLGEMLSFPFSNTFATSRSASHNRGQYMGLFTMMFSAGHVIAPALGMWVAGIAGYHTLWYVVAVMCLISGLGFLWLKGRIQVEGVRLVEVTSKV